jgi:hypothetical protein
MGGLREQIGQAENEIGSVKEVSLLPISGSKLLFPDSELLLTKMHPWPAPILVDEVNAEISPAPAQYRCG